MQCLIIAAGKGSRLRHSAESKPLLNILGIPLIERVIRSACEVGVDDIVVVTGHAEARLRAFLDSLAARLDRSITTVSNPHWQTTENGRSILAARQYLQGPFLLLMADHLVEPALIRTLCATSLAENDIALAVDRDVANPLVDPDDVTRVRLNGHQVVDIGKGLEPFDGFDTGVFLAGPSLFPALEEAGSAGDSSLSGAVRLLAAKGLVQGVDVSGHFWIDVDDEAAWQRAEQALLVRIRGKANDGPVSRHLNRPLSIRLSRSLVRFPITPNQISLLSFLLSVAAFGLFLVPRAPFLAAGGVLAQLASIVDGCDGEVARLKYLSTEYGGWFDAILDRYSDALLLFGLTWHQYSAHGGDTTLWLGFFAIIGSFMLSYTADKYDHLMKKRIEAGGHGLRLGRDVRVFLVFLAAITGLILPVLLLVAVVMNLETIRRVVVLGHD